MFNRHDSQGELKGKLLQRYQHEMRTKKLLNKQYIEKFDEIGIVGHIHNELFGTGATAHNEPIHQTSVLELGGGANLQLGVSGKTVGPSGESWGATLSCSLPVKGHEWSVAHHGSSLSQQRMARAWGMRHLLRSSKARDAAPIGCSKAESFMPGERSP